MPQKRRLARTGQTRRTSTTRHNSPNRRSATVTRRSVTPECPSQLSILRASITDGLEPLENGTYAVLCCLAFHTQTPLSKTLNRLWTPAHGSCDRPP